MNPMSGLIRASPVASGLTGAAEATRAARTTSAQQHVFFISTLFREVFILPEADKDAIDPVFFEVFDDLSGQLFPSAHQRDVPVSEIRDETIDTAKNLARSGALHRHGDNHMFRIIFHENWTHGSMDDHPVVHVNSYTAAR